MSNTHEDQAADPMSDAVREARRQMRMETWNACLADAAREGRAIPQDAEALQRRFLAFEIGTEELDAAFGL